MDFKILQVIEILLSHDALQIENYFQIRSIMFFIRIFKFDEPNMFGL